MSDGRFSVVFGGPAVENGEIDVADFAPAVLALCIIVVALAYAAMLVMVVVKHLRRKLGQ